MDRRVRRLIRFPCAGETLVGTLDEATGTTGLLIVSGGNEVRAGAHRGMAMLAHRLAATGVPVFRYDRRGTGDSSGANGGYADSADDMAAAAACFRATAPHLRRLVGFGNCDAASALALFGRATGIDRIVLANPWVVESGDALPPAAAIRARYAQRLRDPRAWWRMLRGGVDARKLLLGLRKLSVREPDDLAARVLAAITAWGDDAQILLATGDATAIAFADAARGRGLAIDVIDTASHSFAGDAGAALEAAIRRHLDGA